MSPSSPPIGTMSSPTHHYASRRSRFTYRQLSQLPSYQTSNPLRVVAHIDLDAFYAQCEMVRLGVPKDQPLAVQQWQGLIAINYPAREAGISRHCDVTEAKKLCPTLIAQHVATWREGDDKWAYRDDAAANIAKDKVSLDPYRLQCRRILALIKDHLPADKQKVEKASIDEVFLDLSAHVHSLLLERYPELANPAPYDDPTERLPLPSMPALDWKADALIDLDEDQETLDPDWDDVVILIGSEIVRDIRAKIFDELQYTCSAGIASNKLVSKLGSAFKKPNQQTVVRSRAIQSFLNGIKVTKFRNLGGKLGDQLVAAFKTEEVRELLDVPLEQMKVKLGEDTGIWIYNTIRGIDTSEVNSRTQIKSMLSAKSFRPTINNPEQAIKWLRIFVADIHARLVEEGVLENKRRPRSIILHHRYGGKTVDGKLEQRSRGEAIPSGRSLDEELLFKLAQELLAQMSSEPRTWPCSNLSLAVSGFEEGIKGNMGIGGFLVRGEEAQALRNSTTETRTESPESEHHAKRRRKDDGGGGMMRFLSRGDTTPSDHDTARPQGDEYQTDVDSHAATRDSPSLGQQADDASTDPSLVCSRCRAAFIDAVELQSHSDWHMAKDLQDAERGSTAFTADNRSNGRSTGSARGTSQSKRSRGQGRGGKPERGQSKLNFG